MQAKIANLSLSVLVGWLVCVPGYRCPGQVPNERLGIFDHEGDIGTVSPPGNAKFDSNLDAYQITSAGANMWSRTDAFHFVWKKTSGDVILTANIAFSESRGTHDPHRKAVLLFRQTLDPDGVYADAAQHGSGLTALQYRRERGATTQDIELNIDSPRLLRLEKRGDTITMYVSEHGEPLHPMGASIRMHFEDPFYAGIGLCSHNNDVIEKATFTHVTMEAPEPESAKTPPVLYSTLQTIGIEDNFRRALVIATGPEKMEAPNWSRDGKTLYFNRDGHIWTIPAEGGSAAILNTGEATNCTGSHGLSPDGKRIAISCSTPGMPETRVYLVPSTGGELHLLTHNPWSYFHSWSPDGKTIAFTRPNHKGGGDIFSIPVDGGEEKALTMSTGLSDDPDYSANGKWIYFNSDRSGGLMQIWRMRPDGSGAEQITSDPHNNWTPHPSPDGKSVLILSYAPAIHGHPANADVTLRILNVSDGAIRNLVQIVGGAGSDNVPNWAPDSLHFAFVSFQMLPKERSSLH